MLGSMESRKVMLMGGALMFAAFSAITARNLFSSGAASEAAPMKAAPVEPTGPEVLVATRSLPVGTIVTPDAFRYQPWPKELVEKAYYIKGDQAPQATAGSVVRYAITAGQPITQGALVKPGDRGFLAAALGPGMRAVTISVSAQASVAGFVFPGDRVDLLLTSTVNGQGGGGGDPLKASETILRNLRVLATDQRTDKTTDDNGKTVVTSFSNVTLEVTPKLSEKIAVAQTLGTLSLSLRSIADDRMELEREIASGEVSVPDSTDGKGDPKAEQKMLLQIASKPSDTGGTVTTGGEVSRFQRTSVPRGPAPGELPGAPAPVAAAPTAPPRPRGPVVEVVRGNIVTQVALAKD
jgi:pilus assembly protein CpaB